MTATIDKPTTNPPVTQNIPEELKQHDCWVLWEYVWRDSEANPPGRWTKVPYQPTGEMAKANDPSTWTDWLHVSNRPRIGFVVDESNPYTFIDVDNAVDAAGEIKPWALAVTEHFPGYWEISPSGHGLKGIVRGKPRENRVVRMGDGQVELFGTGKYTTLTGRVVDGRNTNAPITDNQRRIDIWFEEHAKRAPKPEPDDAFAPVDDDTVIDRVRTMAPGRQLYDVGDTTGYPSPSEADLALGDLFVIAGAQGEDQLIRLFERSSLARDRGHKWGRRDYAERTARRALDGHVRPGDWPKKNGHKRPTETPLSLAPAPTFPIDILPGPFREFVAMSTETKSLPHEMTAVPLLAFTGGIIGNRAHMQVTSSWLEFPCIYTAVVAPPGTGKTHCLRDAKWIVDVVQKDCTAAFKEAMGYYEMLSQEWEDTPKGERGPKPDKPIQRDVYSTDLTVEALFRMMEHSHGLGIYKDELLAWINSMDMYRGGKGADRQVYLDLWSASDIKLDRAGAPTIHRRYPVAAVVGGIQTDLVSDLAEQAGRRDGFIERILPIVPEAESHPFVPNGITKPVYRGAAELIRLVDRMAPGQEEEDSRSFGYGVRWSDDALGLWCRWHEHNRMLSDASEIGIVKGMYSKLVSYCARFALVLHILWHPEDYMRPLSGETMQMTVELVEFLRVHTGRFLALTGVTTPTIADGVEKRIVKALTKHGDNGTLTRSDLYNRLRHVKVDDFESALVRLKKGGVIERGVLETKPKPTEIVTLITGGLV